ncbi:type IX secretion system anionic LPS delivery protein PorZ [Kaistella pullorum]|uniref:T9SS type A sorting domain-containing protein n=1 Tax=Kaistella pullorum TaxID=2763074 RepID=A0ABR8WQ43_9FLAO|nr:T9SS type A sorting domain-containing protein [Kaistella pullorum]MBD8019003.1 T9SS type A sorting domain-containing protein [Kaistella pullorum]
MKKILPFLLLIVSIQISAQVISSSRWTDLFSYGNVLTVREDNGKLIAATENGIFFYTPSSGEITKLSKANGLHEVKISAFDYNPETKIGLVGYRNGSLDVISPDGITYVVDIPLATGYNGDKKINHISITGNLAVVSVGYGVSVFRLDRKEFGDSAFFTNSSGVYEASREAVIKDNTVYAATATGLKSHEINTTFAIYSTWTNVAAGNMTQLANGGVIAFSDANSVRYGSGTSFSAIPQSFAAIRDVTVTAENIIVTDNAAISVFGNNGTFIKTYQAGETLNTGFFSQGNIYAGTQSSGIKTESGDLIKPDGPYNNTAYKINLQKDKIWLSTGNRTNRFNDAAPHPLNLGFYHYTGSEWVYPSYFKTSGMLFNVMDVAANPADTDEVFFTNFIPSGSQGVYKMKYNASAKDYEFVNVYKTGQDVYFNRPMGLVFDDKNNLYGSIAFLTLENPAGSAGLMSYDRAADAFRYKSLKISAAVQKPIISEGLIWIPLPRVNGITATDYKGTTSVNDDEVFVVGVNNGLPSNSEGVLSVAIDKTGDAWIGTDNGLRVLSSAASNIRNSPAVEPVIIEENGLGEELFRDSGVLQIEVDSGNQKWVSINGGGVFYLSSTGEQTIKHFTKENSPLPNNSVTDIKVDNKTGKVYFVTLDGVMVYQGDVLDVTENFGDVLVYPNPVVYSKYKGNVRIRGLAEKTNIRITDAAGNLVHQAVSRGGYYEWNLNNHRGVRVASGIYFVLMTNADGTDTATAKIAVVN